ncbi:FecR family protein [Barnesiella intestinihominis]|uniref:FecR family protein n=1 Tax=Barnesiella intestinihominis TaxID=487174 RepID=UPI0026754535|nr:FecR family protein [Barnesiella intestinihominis]
MNKGYTFEDIEKFIFDDELFLWAKYGSQSNNFDLNAYKAKYPGESEKIDLAISLIRNTAITTDKNLFIRSYKNNLLHNIYEQAGKKSKRHRLIPIYWSAACILVALSFSALWFLSQERAVSTPDNCLALLSDSVDMNSNIQIIIDEQQSIHVEKNMANISIEKGGVIMVDDVQVANLKNNKEITTSQIVVPYGKRSHMTLPDGSALWINSGSRVIYQSDFEKKRHLYVDGEIYLDVHRDTSHPFIVKTNRIEVKVLGTKFNVSDYHNDPQSSVTLVKGSVEVTVGENSTKLAPNQRLAYESGLMNVKNVDVTPYICWKDDIINFNDMKLHDILRTLSHYYNIPIEGIESLDNEVCYGNMDLNLSIDEILESISHTVELSYRHEGNKIIILP